MTGIPAASAPTGPTLTSSGQPHFYRPAAKSERHDPGETLYGRELPGGGLVTIKRITVAKHAELITAFCTACAEEKQTDQVLCFQRTLARGEVVGITGMEVLKPSGRNAAQQSRQSSPQA